MGGRECGGGGVAGGLWSPVHSGGGQRPASWGDAGTTHSGSVGDNKVKGET